MTKKFTTKSTLGTKRLGKETAEKICPQKKAIILGLRGELGAGKTTFAQGFANGLGVKDKILSPTFIILKKFKIPKKLPARNPPWAGSNAGRQASEDGFRNFFHIDCYRINSGKELLELGFKEIISDPKNIVLIEWPERVESILPKHTMFLNFRFVNMNTREII